MLRFIDAIFKRPNWTKRHSKAAETPRNRKKSVGCCSFFRNKNDEEEVPSGEINCEFVLPEVNVAVPPKKNPPAPMLFYNIVSFKILELQKNTTI